jgi:hypothetical protein
MSIDWVYLAAMPNFAATKSEARLLMEAIQAKGPMASKHNPNLKTMLVKNLNQQNIE